MLLLVKDTKFESKSQLHITYIGEPLYCFYWSKIQNLKANHNQNINQINLINIAFTGQRYKIWKQITTWARHLQDVSGLLLLVKDTKFESKSQRNLGCIPSAQNCFYWSKIQNLKANHNLRSRVSVRLAIAFTGQRYKIWKQITTDIADIRTLSILLLLVKDTKFESKSQHSITIIVNTIYCFYWSKIQNLKANHN